MLVLGVDPGGSTGTALIHYGMGSDDDPVVKPRVVFASTTDQSVTNVLLKQFIIDEAAGRKLDAVVAERYIVTRKTSQLSQQHASLELIGLARGLCQYSDTLFAIYPPSDSKTLFPDAKLRRLGLWQGSDHARDAIRQALTWLHKNRILDPKFLLSGDDDTAGDLVLPDSAPRGTVTRKLAES